MYLSLDSLDVVLDPRDGRARVIQTDHRLASEITERRALSEIAALIRCLNPRRAYDAPPEVFYNCQHQPPEFLGRVVSACGARLWAGDDQSVLAEPALDPAIDEDAVGRIADDAMRALAAELIPSTSGESARGEALAALEAMEGRIVSTGFPGRDDVTQFWTVILELGALAGEAIRATNGGVWFYDPAGPGNFPLKLRCAFDGDSATVNPLGKALKFIDGTGGGDEPSCLARMLASRA